MDYMALVIRFSNDGKRGERKYKLVVAEKRSRRDGRPIELLGHYEKRVGGIIEKKIKQDRVNYWTSQGAQPSVGAKKILEDKKN
jgi:small subunit ribosomal protein S16